jgi:hypothetical protein
MTNAGKTGVGLCLSLLADAFSGDDEDDDEGVMCWRNGCSSLCVFLLLLCFPGGCCFVAPLEEKKLLETETKGQRRWRGRAGWSFCVFFCLSSFLLLVPVVFFLVRLFSGFLSRASRLVSTEKKWLLLLWGSVEAGLGLRRQRGLLWVQGRNGRERGMARRGTGFGCSLSLSLLSKGNGNEWAVGKSEMRKSGKVVGYV